MQPDQRHLSYLWDMRSSAERIAELVDGATFDDFGPNSMLRLAVERLMEIIGEAARRVPDDVRASHPLISWGAIIGQRNIIAHEYGEIDPRILWVTANKDMLPLIAATDAIIPSDSVS